jgi:dTMP kinase
VKRGWLIAFEGVDGSGKTTQVELLATALRDRGLRVVTTREPTDGPLDRREHVHRTVAPALERGAVVVTDRYFLSTVAYQGAHGHAPDELLARSEAEFPIPDLVLLLELPAAHGLERVHSRGASEPVFEQREYLEAVASIFRSIDRDYVERVDAAADPATVHARVWRIVVERLELEGAS